MLMGSCLFFSLSCWRSHLVLCYISFDFSFLMLVIYDTFIKSSVDHLSIRFGLG